MKQNQVTPFVLAKNTTMDYKHRHMSHNKIDISDESEWSREKCYVSSEKNLDMV